MNQAEGEQHFRPLPFHTRSSTSTPPSLSHFPSSLPYLSCFADSLLLRFLLGSGHFLHHFRSTSVPSLTTTPPPLLENDDLGAEGSTSSTFTKRAGGNEDLWFASEGAKVGLKRPSLRVLVHSSESKVLSISREGEQEGSRRREREERISPPSLLRFSRSLVFLPITNSRHHPSPPSDLPPRF